MIVTLSNFECFGEYIFGRHVGELESARLNWIKIPLYFRINFYSKGRRCQKASASKLIKFYKVALKFNIRFFDFPDDMHFDCERSVIYNTFFDST